MKKHDSMQIGVGLLFMILVMLLIYPLAAKADGTGVFINNRGDIMTNQHVIDDVNKHGLHAFFVIIDGKAYTATVIRQGVPRDLAIIRINYKSPCLPVKDKVPNVGDTIYPLMFNLLDGKYEDYDNKKTIFSAKIIENNTIIYTSGQGDHVPPYFGVDGEVQNAITFFPAYAKPGNSGSPVLDKDNAIVNVVFAGTAGDSAALTNIDLRVFVSQNKEYFNCPIPATGSDKEVKSNLVWIYGFGE